MIQNLKPLTIANSSKGNPSVLLTSDFEKYIFYRPLDRELLLQLNLYNLIYKHFKVEVNKVGVFQYKGVKYLCLKKNEGSQEVEDWMSFLWKNKRDLNSFINPEMLFKVFLIERFFPIFDSSVKWLIPGKRERFIVEGVPVLRNSTFSFSPVEKITSHFEIKRILKLIIKQLPVLLEDFNALHHEELYKDIKYQVSLFSDIRNQYWEELKDCFTASFRENTTKEIQNFIISL